MISFFFLGYGDVLESCGFPVNASLLKPGLRDQFLELYGNPATDSEES